MEADWGQLKSVTDTVLPHTLALQSADPAGRPGHRLLAGLHHLPRHARSERLLRPRRVQVRRNYSAVNYYIDLFKFGVAPPG